ncbi:hypothetical protein FB157_11198 [Streptomyces sp. BK340]|nr:hypothetical protein FB157_11198 [Streptomyces sp. BK340]
MDGQTLLSAKAVRIRGGSAFEEFHGCSEGSVSLTGAADRRLSVRLDPPQRADKSLKVGLKADDLRGSFAVREDRLNLVAPELNILVLDQIRTALEKPMRHGH